MANSKMDLNILTFTIHYSVEWVLHGDVASVLNSKTSNITVKINEMKIT